MAHHQHQVPTTLLQNGNFKGPKYGLINLRPTGLGRVQYKAICIYVLDVLQWTVTTGFLANGLKRHPFVSSVTMQKLLLSRILLHLFELLKLGQIPITVGLWQRTMAWGAPCLCRSHKQPSAVWDHCPKREALKLFFTYRVSYCLLSRWIPPLPLPTLYFCANNSF